MTMRTLPAESIQRTFELYPNVGIRKLAAYLDTSYGKLLKASKEPIVGVPYDPEAMNWAALAALIDADRFETLDWEAMNAKPTAGSSASTPKSMDAFVVGSQWYLRKDNETPFQVVHVTQTHIVIQQVGTETPYVWSHGTFLINGPVSEPRTKEAKVKGVSTTYTDMEPADKQADRVARGGKKFEKVDGVEA